jgi:hypothetical protein
MDAKVSYIPVEVYLPSSVFRGNLLMKQKRLSDSLNSKVADGIIRLDDVEIQSFRKNSAAVKSKNALIYTRQVTFVVDLSPSLSTGRETEELSMVNKEPRKVLMEVGSFWMQGDVHLVPGFELSQFAEGKSSFIPLTSARFVDLPGSEPRTFMINREKVSCLMPFTEVMPSSYARRAKQKHTQNHDTSQTFQPSPFSYEDR